MIKTKQRFEVMCGSRSAICSTPRQVYQFIIENIFDQDLSHPSLEAHATAANAEAWCEVPEGDYYGADEFGIYLL